MHEVLERVNRGESLSMAEMAAAIDGMLQGTWPAEEIGRFLLALREKGETVDEIAGAAAALRRNMTPIRTRREGVIDTCGTGGDASGTFNISTAAAIVAAAAGVPVAKHGNRSITSKSGSADVLAALGVNIDAPVPVVERCLDEVGLCFCFAPQLHPAMKHVGPIRRSLGVPTIFNLLGPLCNPASAPFQLLGVGKAELRPRLAAALARLGATRAVVVCGSDGLDEVTLAGPTNVSLVEAGQVTELQWTPADFGVPSAELASLRIDGPEASAVMIRGVLGGGLGPARDIVVINAAAALWTAGRDSALQVCAAQAADALDSGRAAALLQRLIETSRS